MMNIHLCNDQKFINKAVFDFEKFYPDQNIFFINKKIDEAPEFVTISEIVQKKDFKRDNIAALIDDLVVTYGQVNIFVHALDKRKARIVSDLSHSSYRTYWIFYGVDLYKRLYNNGLYSLYDNQSSATKLKLLVRKLFWYSGLGPNQGSIKKFIYRLDYFCFWNVYDYKLLKKFYKTKAVYRNFMYDSHSMPPAFIESKDQNLTCMVNHSGSTTGNHMTILRRLNSPDLKNKISRLIIPLSYGNERVVNEVDSYCKKSFPISYWPLKDFVLKEEYLRVLASVNVAFFGHRRQEAAFNILFLIASGAQIFLRRDNNLLKLLKDLGVCVFVFEDDLCSPKSLEPLEEDIQKSNRVKILDQFSKEKFAEAYRNLIV